MEIAVSYEQGRVPVTVLHVQGEINANSYEQLQAQAQAAVEAGTRDMLLDLAEVTFISSAGLRALHYAFTLVRTDSPAESDAALSKGLRDGTWRSPHLKLLTRIFVDERRTIDGIFLELRRERDRSEHLCIIAERSINNLFYRIIKNLILVRAHTNAKFLDCLFFYRSLFCCFCCHG